jgi:hypothetical protein
MTELTDEQLIGGFMVIMFACMIVNFIYIRSLNGFFKELAEKDPKTWDALGSPGPGDQYANDVSVRPPLFKMLGVMREKAARGGYPRAEGSMRWFIIAAITTSLIFLLAIGVGLWMEFLSQG